MPVPAGTETRFHLNVPEKLTMLVAPNQKYVKPTKRRAKFKTTKPPHRRAAIPLASEHTTTRTKWENKQQEVKPRET
jgi:hypothetical protein